MIDRAGGDRLAPRGGTAGGRGERRPLRRPRARSLSCAAGRARPAARRARRPRGALARRGCARELPARALRAGARRRAAQRRRRRSPGASRRSSSRAHYDTKDLPGFVGANDGAGGTAAVLELARVLRRDRRAGGPRACASCSSTARRRPRGTRDFLRDGLRGSRAYARRHAGGPAATSGPARLRRQPRASHPARGAARTLALWARLRAAAARVGVARRLPGPARGRDLRRPHAVRRAGMPAIDLIDFDYPLLAHDPRRSRRGVGSAASTRRARRSSSCCGASGDAEFGNDLAPGPPRTPAARRALPVAGATAGRARGPRLGSGGRRDAGRPGRAAAPRPRAARGGGAGDRPGLDGDRAGARRPRAARDLLRPGRPRAPGRLPRARARARAWRVSASSPPTAPPAPPRTPAGSSCCSWTPRTSARQPSPSCGHGGRGWRDGAVVALHDYGHRDFPGVAEAVRELGLEGEATGGIFAFVH